MLWVPERVEFGLFLGSFGNLLASSGTFLDLSPPKLASSLDARFYHSLRATFFLLLDVCSPVLQLHTIVHVTDQVINFWLFSLLHGYMYTAALRSTHIRPWACSGSLACSPPRNENYRLRPALTFLLTLLTLTISALTLTLATLLPLTESRVKSAQDFLSLKSIPQRTSPYVNRTSGARVCDDMPWPIMLSGQLIRCTDSTDTTRSM